jgi:hypothetical protein
MRKYPIYITNIDDSRLTCFLSYLRDYYDDLICISTANEKWHYKVDIDESSNKIIISNESVEVLAIDPSENILKYRESISELFNADGLYNIYSLYSFMGGVGKNTIASSLARVLDNKGKSTLLIDYDIFTGSKVDKLNMSKVLYRLSTRKNGDLDLNIEDGYISGFINPKDFNFFGKDNMETLLNYIGREKRYENIVIILPRYINDGVTKALKMSKKIILINDYHRYRKSDFDSNLRIAEGCGVESSKVISLVNKSLDSEFIGEDCFNIPRVEVDDSHMIDRSVNKLINYL